jgi:hypothetical protein
MDDLRCFFRVHERPVDPRSVNRVTVRGPREQIYIAGHAFSHSSDEEIRPSRNSLSRDIKLRSRIIERAFSWRGNRGDARTSQTLSSGFGFRPDS